MEPFPMAEVGEIIRKTRKERGLRLEDLADEQISTATISNIERGVPHVSKERALYLLQKLNIDTEHLPALLEEEKQALERLQDRLFYIECLGTSNPEKALRKLDELDIDDGHLYAPTLYYLKGKFLAVEKQWAKAKHNLKQAIHLATTKPIHRELNTEAASYLELGFCAYKTNNLDIALSYTRKGLNVFNLNGNKKYSRYTFIYNIAIYLERLGRISESLELVLSIWDHRKEIFDKNILLGLYWLRAELSRKSRLFKDAIQYSKEGLEIARLNNDYMTMFTLWNVLGSVYMTKKDLAWAKECLMAALDLVENIDPPNLVSTVYRRLGVLYISERKVNLAEEMLHKAVEISEQANDMPRLLPTLIVLGDLYQTKGEEEKAHSTYERVLTMAKQHGYRKLQSVALLRLPDFWKAENMALYFDHIDEMI
jgi:tetratricopeptide (TPR) repeat protein